MTPSRTAATLEGPDNDIAKGVMLALNPMRSVGTASSQTRLRSNSKTSSTKQSENDDTPWHGGEVLPSQGWGWAVLLGMEVGPFLLGGVGLGIPSRGWGWAFLPEVRAGSSFSGANRGVRRTQYSGIRPFCTLISSPTFGLCLTRCFTYSRAKVTKSLLSFRSIHVLFFKLYSSSPDHSEGNLSHTLPWLCQPYLYFHSVLLSGSTSIPNPSLSTYFLRSFQSGRAAAFSKWTLPFSPSSCSIPAPSRPPSFFSS